MINKEQFFEKIAKVSGQTVDEVNKEFMEMMNSSELSIYQPEMKEQVVMNKMFAKYRKLSRVPDTAQHFEGIIIGDAGKFDVLAKRIREIKDKFRADPDLARLQRIVDEQGRPLDLVQTWSTGRANPNYGKPLPEHSYVRNLYGIASVKGKNEFKEFVLTLNGTLAEELEAPMFKNVTFIANNKSSVDAKKFQLTGLSVTKFNSVDNSIPDVKKILEAFSKVVPLTQLKSWYEQFGKDMNSVVITEGIVTQMNLNPNNVTGNRMLTVDDFDALFSEDGKESSVVCWLPSHLQIDFGEQSKIIIVGRPSVSKRKDMLSGEETEGGMMMGVWGIYALPEFKIPVVETKSISNEKELIL